MDFVTITTSGAGNGDRRTQPHEQSEKNIVWIDNGAGSRVATSAWTTALYSIGDLVEFTTLAECPVAVTIISEPNTYATQSGGEMMPTLEILDA